MEQTYATAAEHAQRMLAKRWSDVQTIVVDDAPASAILDAIKRVGATTVVLGWRGHGKFRRLLAGSVARTVAARATCPVLIVRAQAYAMRRLVIGYDGSENAERAIDFVASLHAPWNARVHVVTAVEPVSPPGTVALLPPSVRARVRHSAAEVTDERCTKAQRAGELAVRRLERAAWKAAVDVRLGDPLVSLLTAATEYRADVLVLGARAKGFIERALLGSVANGAVNRARIPVLLVR
jgi:nucleotide-binding universal stress UspA family protein